MKKNMTNMYILISGGHTGVGLGLTKKLLSADNKIGLIIRSEARKEETINEFAEFSNELVDGIDFFYADLSDQAQVKAVAAEVSAAWPRIDRLFNNAGILTETGRKSPQGNELHLEINALSPYLLTQELKPLLLNAVGAKVISTGTDGMQRRNLDIAPLMGTTKKRALATYYQSKQAMMMLMNDMAASWDGVDFVTVNPGPNKTGMTTSSDAPAIIKFISRFFTDPSVGSKLLYKAGFSSKFAESNAVYITKNNIASIKSRMTDQEKQALLAKIKVA